jgi:hypothetical protein
LSREIFNPAITSLSCPFSPAGSISTSFSHFTTRTFQHHGISPPFNNYTFISSSLPFTSPIHRTLLSISTPHPKLFSEPPVIRLYIPPVCRQTDFLSSRLFSDFGRDQLCALVEIYVFFSHSIHSFDYRVDAFTSSSRFKDTGSERHDRFSAGYTWYNLQFQTFLMTSYSWRIFSRFYSFTP